MGYRWLLSCDARFPPGQHQGGMSADVSPALWGLIVDLLCCRKVRLDAFNSAFVAE